MVVGIWYVDVGWCYVYVFQVEFYGEGFVDGCIIGWCDEIYFCFFGCFCLGQVGSYQVGGCVEYQGGQIEVR